MLYRQNDRPSVEILKNCNNALYEWNVEYFNVKSDCAQSKHRAIKC